MLGAKTVSDIVSLTGAGSECSGCRDAIQGVLEEATIDELVRSEPNNLSVLESSDESLLTDRPGNLPVLDCSSLTDCHELFLPVH
jgi:bacterioferritin-associated ferredoxin